MLLELSWQLPGGDLPAPWPVRCHVRLVLSPQMRWAEVSPFLVPHSLLGTRSSCLGEAVRTAVVWFGSASLWL